MREGAGGVAWVDADGFAAVCGPETVDGRGHEVGVPSGEDSGEHRGLSLIHEASTGSASRRSMSARGPWHDAAGDGAGPLGLRRDLGDWARLIDEGPFASLCFGERMAFDNPDTLVLLGACAAWTSRVRLVTTVIVPQLHEPVPLAKALATADRLSGGRLTVGFGVGGREEDYRAAGADPRPDDGRHGRRGSRR